MTNSHNGVFVQLNVNGDTGFRPAFRDGSNQVRHFMANVGLGYQWGAGTGNVGSFFREYYGPGEHSADYLVNIQGVTLGAMLEKGYSINKAAGWMGRNLGE